MDLTNLNRDKKNRRKSADLSTMIYGKVPPQARECEEAVLGALLLEKDSFDKIVELLKPECFYVDAHQRIFKAIMSLVNRSQPIDTLTLTEELRMREELDLVGGPYYVTKLTNAVVNGANIQTHAKIIYERFLKREQIRICGETISDAYEDSMDAFDCLDKLQQSVISLSTENVKGNITHISDTLIDRFKRLEELRHREDHLTGVPSGFEILDRLTAGWQDTDLIIVAARPSVGKTAFALNIARNASCHKTKSTPVAFFSLEMSKGQLTDRLLSSETGIDLDKIVRAKVDDQLMQRIFETGVQKIAQYPLYIDDTPAMNIFDLKAKCRKLKKSENIGLIVLDYLQLMNGLSEEKKQTNREQEISNISRNLKALAKELKLPIIALSQLSREIEKQKRDPQLSDLRESGAIEQDADMVMFLTRPDYQQTDMADESVMHFADIHIKKHRNGDLAKIPMRTMLNIQRWFTNEEYDRYQNLLKYENRGGFIPVKEAESKLFIQQCSKMNEDDEDPF